MKYLVSLLSLIGLLALSASAAAPTTTYFHCVVKEKSGRRTIKVDVKFAVKGLEFYPDKGELVAYPGANEEQGLIFVSPLEGPNGRYTSMSNLNGQGGDLRVEKGTVRLWGDGDGYQFTDLVVWDLSSREEATKFEGYVRDYGPAYGDTESFKQFISCEKSKTVL
jgi:hypothetical protein